MRLAVVVTLLMSLPGALAAQADPKRIFPAQRHGVDPWGAQVGVGLGYTWRRTTSSDGPVGPRAR
jgi:hypothetical protein